MGGILKNYILWMQGSENGKYQIWGYTYKSNVLEKMANSDIRDIL